jgi:tripartite-type tricarboxylate transporter receptor subunit TctC
MSSAAARALHAQEFLSGCVTVAGAKRARVRRARAAIVHHTRAYLATAAIAVACCGQAAAASLVSYPNRPVRLVVAFAPGGGADIISRVVATKLGDALGYPVVVDNRPGAGGTIGAELAVRASPDGHTLNMATSSYAVNPAIYQLPYDPINGVSPVSRVAVSPFVLVVHPSVSARTMEALIELARQQPGKLNYGSTGQGGITHLGTELLKFSAKIDLRHVPYKGTGPALTDLLGGQIQIILGSILATLPHVKSGKLRPLAVTTAERVTPLPELPTIAESGVPGYELVLWYGVWGPPKLPTAIVARLNQEIRRVLASDDVKARLASEGVDASPSTPEEFRRLIAQDIAKFAKVAAAAKVQRHE